MEHGDEVSASHPRISSIPHASVYPHVVPCLPFEPFVYKSECIQLEKQSKNRPTEDYHSSNKATTFTSKPWRSLLISSHFFKDFAILSRRRRSILLVFCLSKRTRLENSSSFSLSRTKEAGAFSSSSVLRERGWNLLVVLTFSNRRGWSILIVFCPSTRTRLEPRRSPLSFFLSAEEPGAFSSSSVFIRERGWKTPRRSHCLFFLSEEEAGAFSSSSVLRERGWNLLVVLTLSNRRGWSILLVFCPSMRTRLEPPRSSHSLKQKRLEHSPRLLSFYENEVGTSS